MSKTNTTESIDERIVYAAERLLRDVGNSFTMEHLVSTTKLSRATIYRRVGNKEALLRRLADERGVDVLCGSDSRTRILHAARQVVAGHGLLNATMEQIADTAGVGVATVYRQFGDKEHVLRAFIEEASPRATVHELAMHPTADVVADLTAIANAILPFLYTNRDILHIILSATSAEQRYIQQLRAGPNRFQDRLTEYFATQLAEGRLEDVGYPQELALAFFGMLLSFALVGPRYYNLPLHEPDRIAHLIVRLFMDGVRR